MAVSRDIFRAWAAPARIMRKQLDAGRREDRALILLMVACGLIFIAQWPRLSRVAHLTEAPLDRLVAYEFAAWLMVWPLAFYALAALSHLAAKLAGGKGDWLDARMALFWSLLASTPAALLYGMLAGFNGPDEAGTRLMGAVWLAGFVVIWIASLREAER